MTALKAAVSGGVQLQQQMKDVISFIFMSTSIDKKKRSTFKKADSKREGHYNSSLTSSSKVMPADDMADMAAVNPNAEARSSPVGTPVVPSPFTPPVSGVYQGNMIVLPPPRPSALQQLPTQNVMQREAGNWGSQQHYPVAGFAVPQQHPQAQLHCQAPVAHFVPANFQVTSQPFQQIQGQFVPPTYHQAPQYQVPEYQAGSGMPVQGVVYGRQAVPGHAHEMTAAQSLPTSTSLTGIFLLSPFHFELFSYVTSSAKVQDKFREAIMVDLAHVGPQSSLKVLLPQ